MKAVDLREDIVAAIEGARADLLRISREIHAHPELNYQEHFAAGLLSEQLAKWGFAVERAPGGVETAFVARRSGCSSRPAVAFLAEYDALPGIGHGCGHNLIATAAVAAGIGLSAVIDSLEGSVLVIGCPAEEGGGGKIRLIEAGVFAGLDATLMVHPGSHQTIVPVEPGSGKNLAMYGLRFAFHGKAAHAAAAPAEGINALNAVLHTFAGVDSLRQHLRDDTRIHGIITDGGQAPNVVPEFAACVMMMRSPDRTYLSEVIEKVKDVARGAALMTGARLEFSEAYPFYYEMRPNHALAARFAANLVACGVEVAPPGTTRSAGSTDYGNVSHLVPSCEVHYAISEQPIAGHSREKAIAALSTVAEEATLAVAKGMALTGLDVLLDAEFRTALWDEHTRETKGEGSQSSSVRRFG
jgi:amidohydrolase